MLGHGQNELGAWFQRFRVRAFHNRERTLHAALAIFREALGKHKVGLCPAIFGLIGGQSEIDEVNRFPQLIVRGGQEQTRPAGSFGDLRVCTLREAIK